MSQAINPMFIPITEPEPTVNLPVTNPAILSGDKIQKLIREASEAARREVIAQTEALIGESIAEMQSKIDALGKPQRVIAAIKINELPPTTFTKGVLPSFLPRMIFNAKNGINTLLVGPAGCGKSESARMVAEAMNLPFCGINHSAGVSESDIFGRQTAQGPMQGAFTKAYASGAVIMLDEICKADPNVATSYNNAIENGYLFVKATGETIQKHPNTVIIAGANSPRGSDGVNTATMRQDATFLNRFVMIAVDYQPEIDEAVCPDEFLRLKLQNARLKLRDKGSKELITYRTLRDAYKQKIGGISLSDILESIALGWPKGLAQDVGLTA